MFDEWWIEWENECRILNEYDENAKTDAKRTVNRILFWIEKLKK